MTLTWQLSGFADEIGDDPALQIAVLQAVGASHIEIRSVWGTNVMVLTDAQISTFKTMLDAAGIKVSAIGSPLGKVDVTVPVAHEVDRLKRIIEVARQFDAKYIRIFSFYPAAGQNPDEIADAVVERLTAMADLAAASGVTLLHENEKGIYGDTPTRCAEIMRRVNSPALRVAWDAANFVQCGVQPHTEGWALLEPYLEYVQVKDALLADGTVVPAGEGDGEMPATIAALVERGYTGFVSLEPHLMVAGHSGGYSGPIGFGRAARALRTLTDAAAVTLA